MSRVKNEDKPESKEILCFLEGCGSSLPEVQDARERLVGLKNLP
jgi:hypothetical protein